ncbi:MAG: large conductance mechanosensitive channel protein MscL [Actinomycetota bacterium]|nr:large conductance mechanosensitive channel protein MscL [Actinomycetota bacterium]
MLREFRDFLLRGNIVELAVAFVIGVAFGALVNSFVDNLLMPVIGMIVGKRDFRDLTFTINDSVFRYGAFLTDLLAFVAIAAAVFFFVVKPLNALMNRLRSPAEEGMPDEERRHQELLAALRESRAS